MRDRSSIAVIWSIPLIAAALWLCPEKDPEQYDQDRFWAVKTHGSARYDMVLVGDSRTYRGVSPAAMQDVLGDVTILNFGYSGSGLSPLMFREAERRLDPESPRRTIVLGVTPYSLTPVAAENEHLRQELGRSKADVLQRMYLSGLLKFFAPTSPRTVWLALSGGSEKRSRYVQQLHDDGWIASRRYPEIRRAGVRDYEEMFEKTHVDPAVEDGVIRQVEDWVARGIRVYGCRPPSSSLMVDLEDRVSGFDEEAFARRFRAAGGVWFEFSEDPYGSYDGSHLRKESAVRFSSDLAGQIRLEEQQKR